jgi:hypothetical protein
MLTFDSVGEERRFPAPGLGGCARVLILGTALLVIGFLTAVPIIWSIGVAVLAGLVVMVLGPARHAVGPRRPIF